MRYYDSIAIRFYEHTFTLFPFFPPFMLPLFSSFLTHFPFSAPFFLFSFVFFLSLFVNMSLYHGSWFASPVARNVL
jgi:hypothetical protein